MPSLKIGASFWEYSWKESRAALATVARLKFNGPGFPAREALVLIRQGWQFRAAVLAQIRAFVGLRKGATGTAKTAAIKVPRYLVLETLATNAHSSPFSFTYTTSLCVGGSLR